MEETDLIQAASDTLQSHEKLCHLMKQRLKDVPQAKQGSHLEESWCCLKLWYAHIYIYTCSSRGGYFIVGSTSIVEESSRGFSLQIPAPLPQLGPANWTASPEHSLYSSHSQWYNKSRDIRQASPVVWWSSEESCPCLFVDMSMVCCCTEWGVCSGQEQHPLCHLHSHWWAVLFPGQPSRERTWWNTRWGMK